MSAYMLSTVLTELNETSNDIEASGLVSIDGLVIAAVFPMKINEDKVGSMSAAMFSLSEQTVKDMRCGELEQIYIKGENGYVLMTYAGNEVVLTVMVKSKAKLGLIFLDIKRAVKNITELL